MANEKFLTARWNNWLTLVFGIPILAFGIVFLSTDVMSDFSGFVAMLVAGVVYLTAVEWHSARRSAWQRETVGGPEPDRLRGTRRFIFFVYNIAYWVPMVLPFTPVIDYRTGFITFFGIVIIRGIINAYRNNFLTLEQGERFPLRIP